MMKTIEAKVPGVIDLFVEGSSKKHIIRRDFIDDYSKLNLGVSKRLNEKRITVKSIEEAGLTFFKALGINGYTIDYYLVNGILKGYNLDSSEMLKAFTICGLNEIMNTNLSHDELVSICNKLSINFDAYISNQPVYFDQDDKIIDKHLKSDDIFYLLIKLPKDFTTDELVRYFMKDETLSFGIEALKRFEPLIYIKKILTKNHAQVISTNGYSNILVASFNDVHDRFKASYELNCYESRKLTRGNGFSYIKCYR